jgi:hypothetical protein
MREAAAGQVAGGVEVVADMARPFEWTPAKEQAARLEWQGVPQGDIALHLGVSRRTVEGWARRREFRARLAQLRATGGAGHIAPRDRIAAEDAGVSARSDTPAPYARAREECPDVSQTAVHPRPPQQRPPAAARRPAPPAPPVRVLTAEELEDLRHDQAERVGRVLAQLTELAQLAVLERFERGYE